MIFILAIAVTAQVHYINTADSKDISIGNTNELFIDVSTNRVGISTTTPENILQVKGASTFGGIDGTAGTMYLYGSTAGRYSRIVTTNGNLHIDADYGNGAAFLYLNYYKGAGISPVQV